ncbi:MAG TPA: hypothetical protein VF493_22045 [Terriglobales bacterium]
MTNIVTDETTLRDLVARYKICWEVWPEGVFSKSHVEEIGYELELLGTHAEGTEHVNPGCGACIEVYEALHQIANWLIPQNTTIPSRFEIEPFEPALRYASVRHQRPDVVLEIKILHRCGLAPIDECEKHCVKVMQDKLSSIGAYRGCWAPNPDYPSRKYKGDRNAKCH